jgi:hypothetical protein
MLTFATRDLVAKVDVGLGDRRRKVSRVMSVPRTPGGAAHRYDIARRQVTRMNASIRLWKRRADS